MSEVPIVDSFSQSPTAKRARIDPEHLSPDCFKSHDQKSINYFFGGSEPDCSFAKKYGFKVYSNLEIDSATGKFEKEFRKFWNKEAEMLARDSRLRTLGKLQLHGIINTAWSLHKSTLLKLEIQQLEQLEKRVSDTDFRIKKRDDSVVKNFERMEVAHFAIETTHEQLKKLKRSLISLPSNSTVNCSCREAMRKEILDTESRLHADIHELKKAQDALRKAIMKRMAEIEDQLLKEESEQHVINTDLDEAEEAALVQLVQDPPVVP